MALFAVAGGCLITSDMSICGRMHVAAWAVSLGWLGSQPLAWRNAIPHTRVMSVMHESMLAFPSYTWPLVNVLSLTHTRARTRPVVSMQVSVDDSAPWQDVEAQVASSYEEIYERLVEPQLAWLGMASRTACKKSRHASHCQAAVTTQPSTVQTMRSALNQVLARRATDHGQLWPAVARCGQM